MTGYLVVAKYADGYYRFFGYSKKCNLKYLYAQESAEDTDIELIIKTNPRFFLDGDLAFKMAQKVFAGVMNVRTYWAVKVEL